MGKALTEPLFIIIVLLLIAQFALYRGWRRHGRFGRSALVAFSFATLLLWGLSTHVAETHLVQRLSDAFPIPTEDQLAEIDVVIVLSGGLVVSPDPRYDQLDASTIARVWQGARTFLASDARVLVMSGRWTQGDPERMVRLMKETAIQLGIPQDRIILEPNALTTRDHPTELRNLNVVQDGETVAVVTSSWHLPRAMKEFSKVFSNLVAVPAYHIPIDQRHGMHAWLPRARSLHSSTTAIAEIVGMIWYRNPFL